ncbi:MAG: hypothetical protein MHM6MM_003443 [Cercozoa sp. M6MM]
MFLWLVHVVLLVLCVAHGVLFTVRARSLQNFTKVIKFWTIVFLGHFCLDLLDSVGIPFAGGLRSVVLLALLVPTPLESTQLVWKCAAVPVFTSPVLKKLRQQALSPLIRACLCHVLDLLASADSSEALKALMGADDLKKLSDSTHNAARNTRVAWANSLRSDDRVVTPEPQTWLELFGFASSRVTQKEEVVRSVAPVDDVHYEEEEGQSEGTEDEMFKEDYINFVEAEECEYVDDFEHETDSIASRASTRHMLKHATM